ncbi:MAG TPA: helix-turn-helix transcriptional regulator [Gemmataceae bacterium]|nr:helix-turn-helix transcriptional regulator [Gemmataceae bacterium]
MSTAAHTKRTRKAAPRASRQPRPAVRHAGGPGPTLREDFGLTRKTLARMTGLSDRTLASWEAGARLSESAARVITSVERLLRALAEVVHRTAIAGWLDTPNETFDGLKPVEVMERGQADRIWRMIYFLGSGTAS